MLRNIFKVGLRNLFKDKFYSFLNIIGLAIGITASFLIILYVVDELSYEQSFEDKDRIYRVVTAANFGDQQLTHIAASSAPLAGGFKNHIPEVETITRFQPSTLFITKDDNMYKEDMVFFADSTFLDVFSYEVLAGDPEELLTEPNSLVLTRKAAVKYFGEKAMEEGNIVGEILKTKRWGAFAITGVLEDFKGNSHIDFDMLVSMSTNQDALNPIWISMNYFTYLKLIPQADPAAMEGKFRDLVTQYVVPQVIQYMNFPEDELTPEKVDQNFRFYLQPLTDIHLKSKLYAEFSMNSNIQYIYIFSAIALFIIIIASINFMNLATARSARRAKEVGIRKTLGSPSGSITSQFMIESFIFVIIAMLIALGLTEAFRIPFNTISGKSLSFNVFQNPWILAMVLVLTILVGLMAGSYPAFYLTKFKPVDVLKGALTGGKKNSFFRSVLVVLQFIISISLIVSTLLVYKQMHYIQTKDLGFDKENVIVLKNVSSFRDQSESFKQILLRQSEVIAASYTTQIPSDTYFSSAFKADGGYETDYIMFYGFTDFDYDKVIGFEMKHGRYFSKDFPSDSNALVINEIGAQVLGLGGNDCKDAVGTLVETIANESGERIKIEIIGVMKNYHFKSLHSPIEALAFRPGNYGDKLAVRIRPGDLRVTIQNIERLWEENLPGIPFEYSFMDEDYDRMFEKEARMSRIFTIFSILAIVIACLGLFGLAAYTAEQRTKEIGIRKAMGASSYSVVNLLTREFTKLVIISFVIAIPLAWYFMNQWFLAFAYKTSMGIWPFMVAGLLALFIAWLTVSYQSVKAAMANPVDSLRDE
jgi:putative ABC transport system permease protein